MAKTEAAQARIRGVNENGIEIGEYTIFYSDKGAVGRNASGCGSLCGL
jgi:hypothetical protein